MGLLNQKLATSTVALLLLAHVASLNAGNFSSDFNALPAGVTLYGNAAALPTGGVTNSGCLQLTAAVASTNGSFIISTDLDAGTPAVSFTAAFKMLVGGGNGADGFSFNFAPDLPAGGFAEDGAGNGLSVTFDTYDNGAPDYIGIGVKVGGGEIAQFPFAGLRANAFVDVVIQLHPDGTLDILYDGNYAFKNLGTGFVPSPGSLFGFGARTGGSYDSHLVDNLSITTQTTPAAFLDYFYPIGRNVRADAPINIVLTDNNTTVNPSSVVLKLDGTVVTPTVVATSPNTTVTYQPPAIFTSGSSHTVSIVFTDNATPTPNTTSFQYEFAVAAYSALPPALAVDPSFVNLSAPGFFIRYGQIADIGSRDITRAELQLADLLIDGSTGLPYPNLAAPNPTDSTFTRLEPGVINYGYPPGSTGNFPGDAEVPGVPSPTTGNGINYAMDAVTYLHLSPGLYNLGVNSSDGFKLVVADAADIFAPVQAIFGGVRAAADTTVSFSVSADGYYPFRLVYFTGDPAYGPAPGTATPSIEFFNTTKNGDKVLINDTSIVGYIPAFTAAKTRPYVRSVDPDLGEIAVPSNSSITATLVDGTLTVQTGTIELQVNGATVIPTINSAGGVHTISYQPVVVFPPNSSNYASLAYTDSASTRRTNTWSFSTENILTQLWRIPPGSTDATLAKWVTSAATERGLAYNPKTGHVLLVSRNTATGTDGPNGCGVAVLDGSTGTYLKQLNLTLLDGSAITAGPGLFKLNLVDIADDGAIYACNLTTDSSANNLAVYRWADEDASPTVAYNSNPAGTGFRMRVGDTFRVRNSGAGTQIIASQNNAIATLDIGGGTNVVLLTTTDGTNFTSIRLAVPGIVTGDLRLGLSFGCGDDFYGSTTAAGNTQMRYAGFNVTSGATTLLATYLLNNPAVATVGPIGIDIPNQRVIGNATSGTAGNPHSMNLYDFAMLAPSPATNFILDRKVFGTANSAFGTGAIDFTPDGTRLFTLDTANGIVAFSLAPRLAAPVICANPQANIVPELGSLGFMSVGVVGSPLHYQWRFNGSPMPNATNRTLDISNVQASKLGYYSVIVTNAMGSATSTAAVLDTKMLLTSQPASQITPVGGAINLSVAVSGGLPAYTYQWALNGTNIAGATASAYSLANAPATSAGSYLATITDSLGQRVVSEAAAVTVGTLGTGTGLHAEYFNVEAFTTDAPAGAFASFPAVTRVDPTVDFDWGTDIQPDAAIGLDYFTVRWHGQVQPLYSQVYTFYTRSDDGSQLWVNNQLVVTNWTSQAPTERSGTIALEANQKYDLIMEYFEKAGGAVAQLSWSSLSQGKQIIPMTQLYPATGPLTPRLTSSLQNGTNVVLNWSGTATLESSTNVAGPYTLLLQDTRSPYLITPGTEPIRFFRVLSQQAQ
jgi:hypothetical protein